ncbi:homoserine kinase [Mailhella massiliensis]|uniref:homoserine kinase n=1 Tax=Mailhella massiliensis TaxID=1903261 RepID=UPI00097DCE89|nr:homoserine kinase [Mailhella massiliensis]
MTAALSERKDAPSQLHVPESGCITFIGMAGAGKTTVGRMVARSLGWAFVDSDHIIEAAYAAPLQSVADAMSKEAFIDMEAEIVGRLRLCRTVIATGGSVVYRESSMKHLASLGPVVYLDVPMKIILERIARNPDRGLAIAPGQTLEELFREREELYRRYATVSVPAYGLAPAESARLALEQLAFL